MQLRECDGILPGLSKHGSPRFVPITGYCTQQMPGRPKAASQHTLATKIFR
jgi:hypothetical protein